MITEEQKYEHTHERVMSAIEHTREQVKYMIESSGLDIDTTDFENHFESLKSNIEIMMES
jgi:hypothetical protein|tara:strand:- start:409 stop:588 length:180 start_codon:yes stop_codon:yes gene_type:complete